MPTIFIWTIQILGGVVFALSSFVIVRWYRAWKRQKSHPLPLHVWSIAISYNMLVLSLMFRIPKGGVAFAFGCAGLLLGSYSLWVLSKYQNRPR